MSDALPGAHDQLANGTFYLSDVDGFEFQKVCKIIFERAGYGRVEELPLVGDGGRDLIIHTAQGKIVVECKHRPNTSLGRPIIQKLHSAVISEGAVKGIVVTTGGFSKQAIEHAGILKPPIELVDMAVLRDLASRAGVRLISGQEPTSIATFRLLDGEEADRTAVARLSGRVVSRPAAVADAYSSKKVSASLRPVYRIEYRINAQFSTGAGMVHSESSTGRFFIDGHDGAVLPDNVADYFSRVPREAFRRWEDLPAASRHDSRPFALPASVTRGKAMDHIIRKHTKSVRYRGRNNQSYTKVCTPSKNDVLISDLSQMYLPEYRIDYSLAGRDQSMEMANNGTSAIFLTRDTTETCPFCKGRPASNGRSLCNDCGRISCAKRSFLISKRHALSCEVCGKTLCPDCALYVRKALLLKAIVCAKCGEARSKEGKRVRKLVPAPQSR